MTDYPQIIADQNANIKELFTLQPELSKAWSTMKGATITDGALDKKTRELIALAMGVAAQCDPCLAYHAKACLQYGATRAEVAEMLGVCVMMGGGPKLMYAAKALQAYDQFAAQTNA